MRALVSNRVLFGTALILLLMTTAPTVAQLRAEPPDWWLGMNNPSLQLMVVGEGIGKATPSLNYDGVSLEAWHRASSPNYLFLDLLIDSGAAAGTLPLMFTFPGGETSRLHYALQQREHPATAFKGFNSDDVIYLITPDRFANGNPDNDTWPGMREQKVDRSDDYGRHGGDIQGIRDHLDYIADMGFTALWSSPLLENDMPESSYHGYAITDFYKVDPRFGTLEEYKALSAEAASLGIKLIMDQVANHCGLYHWWMEDLPFEDWIHYQQEWQEGKPYTVTNHQRTVNQDAYAATSDRELMNAGWFVPSMPDLNQDNPFLARYLIQNSIWWVETLKLGGIRQDTYPYPDKDFMAEWARAIMEEYPNFNIVGEEWSYNPLLVAYWQHGMANRDGYQSWLRSTMDFPLQQDLVNALKQEEGWDAGLNVLYQSLANDFIYPRPEDLLLFADNHDMDRLYTQVGQAAPLAEMAMAFVLTAPRTPQVYYGTEILMQNSAKPGDHGLIRTEFPGGWQDSPVNAFTGKGLLANQKRMQQRMRRLLQFRKGSAALKSGKTLHFAPQDGIYLMARKAEEETVVLLLNKNKKAFTLNLERFAELGLSGEMREILREETMDWTKNLTFPAQGAYILTTSK